MSAQIIPINQSFWWNDVIQTVDARDLHAFLGVKKTFETWITERIDQYGFESYIDYMVSPEDGLTSTGGGTHIVWHLSLDMAKALSMVEQTTKGRQAHRYFIERELSIKEKFQILMESELEDSVLKHYRQWMSARADWLRLIDLPEHSLGDTPEIKDAERREVEAILKMIETQPVSYEGVAALAHYLWTLEGPCSKLGTAEFYDEANDPKCKVIRAIWSGSRIAAGLPSKTSDDEVSL